MGNSTSTSAAALQVDPPSTQIRDASPTNERTGYELSCCLLNITIPVDSNVLLLMPYTKYLHEYEVLLNDQVVFKFVKNIYLEFNGLNAVTNIQIVNENNENFFNKPSYNHLLEKTRQRNKSMELFIQRSAKYTNNPDFEKEKYYKIYVK